MGGKISNNAQKVYQMLCDVLDKRKLQYEKTVEKLSVRYSANVCGMELPFYVEVDGERDIISMYVKMPFDFSGARLIEGAYATSQINYCLYDGSFDYDLRNGEVYFRATAAFKDSEVSKVLIDYMIDNATSVLSDYGNRLLAFSENKISLDDCCKKK